MWVHLPSQHFPSVPESGDSSSESDSLSQDCASSLTWRGTRRQLRHWRDAWRTGRLSPLRSGPTLPSSTVNAGLEAWTSSWAEFRASRSAWPANARDETTSDGSGPTSGAGFGTFDPDSSSWRTFPDLFGMAYPLSLEIWPKRGSLRNGVVSQRRMLERPTVESGYSSWPTPAATEPRQGFQDRTRGMKGTQESLTTVVTNWQTPGTDSFRSRGGERKDEMGLDQQARTWATPRSSVAENRTTKRTPSQMAGRANGGGHGEYLSVQAAEFSHRDQPTGRGGLRTPAPVVLNPAFVEALMGLPPGMTDSTPLETPSFHSWLATHSQRLQQLLASTSMVRIAA